MQGIPGARWSARPKSAMLMLLALLVTALSAAPIQAQAIGRVVGRVIDSETGRGLAGAQVSVEGTRLSVTAGVDGRYMLMNVPSGRRSVSAELIGYAPKQVTDVEVPEGGAVALDIAMAPRAVQIEAITVTAAAERGSVARAMRVQRNAVGVTNAITAEQISRSPDSDAAAAVRRVSGVTVQDGKFVHVRGLGERYTTTSLNGARIPSPEPERKVVPLDLFPAALLESISTSKTFTPDQPGDFSGGQVDIRTREFPATNQVTLSFSTGYNSNATGQVRPLAPSAGGERVAFAADPRRLPEPARQANGSLRRGEEVNQVVNSFRNAWSVQDRVVEPDLSLGLSAGGSTGLAGRSLGYLFSGTYSSGTDVQLDQRRARVGAEGSERDRYDGTSSQFSVLWGGMANVSTMFGTHTRLMLNNSYNRSADNGARIERGTDENTSAFVQIERLQYIERTVRSHQLAAQHQLDRRHRLDWSVTASGVSRHEPDRSEFVTWLDPDVPIWFNDPEGAVRTFGELDESALQAKADYQVEIGGLANPLRVRFGGLYRTSERDAESRGYRIQAYYWAPDDPRWQLGPEQFFDGRFASADDANFLLSPELSGGSYSARDRLTAGYMMLDVPLHARARLVGGARVEHSQVEILAENNLGQPSFADPVYTDVLPSLALNIELSERQKLRLSGSQTLARPEYRELAPVTYREVLGGEQVIGNAELRRTLIRNLDVRWEFYPSPSEVLSLAVFAKDFDSPIEQRYLARSGTDTRTFENAEGAVNYGAEAEIVSSLGRISDRLAAWNVFANATVMHSRVDTGVDGDEPRRMVGQAPYVVNFGATWAPGDWSATVLYNVVGPRIVNARPSGSSVSDVVEMPFHKLDLSLRFPLVGDAAGKIDLKNMLGAPYRVRQGGVDREYHATGRSVSLGVSLRR
jgi:hypothetical protein